MVVRRQYGLSVTYYLFVAAEIALLAWFWSYRVSCIKHSVPAPFIPDAMMILFFLSVLSLIYLIAPIMLSYLQSGRLDWFGYRVFMKQHPTIFVGCHCMIVTEGYLSIHDIYLSNVLFVSLVAAFNILFLSFVFLFISMKKIT